MGWDAAVFGTIKLTAKARAAWLAGTADSTSVDGASRYLATSRFGPDAVGKAIHAIAAAEVAHLELVTDKGPLRIATVLTKDEFIDWAPAIAALFGAAFAHGGTGAVVFCGLEGASFAYEQTAAGLTELTGKALAAVDEHAEMKRLNAIYLGEQEPGETKSARGAKAVKAAKIWALNPFTKKPMRIAASGVTDVKTTRAMMERFGFDPDTGKPRS